MVCCGILFLKSFGWKQVQKFSGLKIQLPKEIVRCMDGYTIFLDFMVVLIFLKKNDHTDLKLMKFPSMAN